MPAYHSEFNDTKADTVCGMSILPLRGSSRGPAPPSKKDYDVIDEAVKFFRANVLFATFEVKGGADRVLMFLTLYISQCLKRLEKAGSKASGQKALFDLSKERFALPGANGWQLGGHIPKPRDSKEQELCQAYMKQLREETGHRLLEALYRHDESEPNKFWMAYSKRKYMHLLVR
mmetsp:Transcript_21919/g.41097  ORF Transcript_21919/g.41097 Transcript_21919/m.41097 type:complete len:175 (+) Transcript_21919:65-589(+)